MKKKMNFTKKMMISLISGLIVGGIFMAVRENVGAGSQLWTTLNNILFQDITKEGAENAIGLFYIIGQLFINALQLILIPLVFTSIIMAVCHIEDTKKLERISLKTIRNFLALTGMALALAAVVGYASYAAGIFNVDFTPTIDVKEGATGSNPLLVFVKLVPNNLMTAFSDNSAILAIVAISIVVGLCVNFLGEKVATFRKLVTEVNQITMTFLGYVITNIGPFAIFALLVRTFASYGIEYLKPAAVYVLLTVPTLLVFMFIVMPAYIKLTTKLNPLTFIKKVIQVAMFGFSTSSSAATLPLNNKVCVENLGVHEDVAAFVVPLGSAINMTGTAIMQVIASLFVAGVAGYSVAPMDLVVILLLTFIASISTPAAPGAGAIVLFTILNGVGFTNEVALVVYSLILAINRPVEMLVTAVNVVDDSVSAVCIAHSEGLLDESIYNDMGKNVKHETTK